jgi:predicted permease
VFQAIGGSVNASFVMTGDGTPERVLGLSTTASLADVFQVAPMIGRWYTEQEDQPGGPKLVILDHAFWVQRFASDRRIVGKTITLNGEPYEVIGVMPPTFSFRRAQVLVPLQRKLDPTTRGSHFLPTLARLKDGVTVERAATEMRALGQTLAKEFGTNHGVDVRSYYEVVVGNIRTPLRVLLGAVFFVLLIACANVANLLLASSIAKRRELAIRVALGAAQRDLARQLVTESVLLAVIGGAIGLMLAYWALGVFVALAGAQLPRGSTVHIDLRVVAVAGGLTLLVGVFCGLWPLIRLKTRELASAVREGDIRSGAAGKRFGNGLVVAEIALAFMLLVGAGLLVKNLMLLQTRDAGIRTDRVVAFDVTPSGPRYLEPEALKTFYRDLYSRLSQVGTIESVGMTSHLPMYNFGTNGEMQIEGGTPWDPTNAPLVEYRWIYGDYLRTMGVPLLKGRFLDQHDGAGTFTVLINQAMAEKFWPGQDALGKRFGQGNDKKQWFQVVGIIGNIRSFGLSQRVPYEFYRTIDQNPFNAMTIVMRTRGDDPTAVIPVARQIVADLDPSMPIAQVQTMGDVVSGSVAQPRLVSALTGVFGGLAGLLAMVGVYAVMAYNVRRQRREFGIRLALGANRQTVRTLVVGRGLLLSVIGIAIGLAGSFVLTRLLSAMLNDVKPTDPWVFSLTAVSVLIVSVLASYPPAHQASRTDPMVVLREA